MIEKICGYCNKPVIKCSYSEMDYGIKPEHLLYYTNTLCFNNGEKHYCSRSCAVSDLKLFDSKIIGKIKESDWKCVRNVINLRNVKRVERIIK